MEYTEKKLRETVPGNFFPEMVRTDEKPERTKFYKILPGITDFSFLPVTDTDNETGDFFILFLVLSWFAYRTGMRFGIEGVRWVRWVR